MTITRDKLLELWNQSVKKEEGFFEYAESPARLERFAALLSEAQEGEPVAWNEAQRICDLPAVDEAIRGFSEDQTGDNATCMVRAILDAAGSLKRPSQAQEPLSEYAAIQKRNAAVIDMTHRPSASGAVGEPITWRCFHCNEYFTDEVEARLHFGRSERQSPACSIDIAEYRAMESRMEAYNDEDADIHRQMARMQIDHAQALRREEEKGYAKGLSDTLSQQSAQVTDALPPLPNAFSYVWPENECCFHCHYTPSGPGGPFGPSRGDGLKSFAIYIADQIRERDAMWQAKLNAALSRVQAAPLQDVWQPMETAPKDGTMLRLLVQFDDNATEDSVEPCPTIGANTFDHSGLDEWKFAGWDWSQDCFTEGIGTPVGWLPFADPSVNEQGKK